MSKQSELFAQFLTEGKSDGLTQREARVATLIVDGIHPRTIAAQFQVAPNGSERCRFKAQRR